MRKSKKMMIIYIILVIRILKGPKNISILRKKMKKQLSKIYYLKKVIYIAKKKKKKKLKKIINLKK